MTLARRLLVLLVAAFVGAAHASSGGLDVRFGTSGIARTNIGFNGGEFRAVALQPDGKTVAVGTASAPSGSLLLIARFNTDGSPDAAFGTTGMVQLASGPTTADGFAVVVQPDGKIAAAGQDGAGRMIVARVNADGSLDTAFGSGGIAAPGMGEFGNARALLLQTDGKLVAGGSRYNPTVPSNEFALFRVNPDGSPDTSFGCPTAGGCTGLASLAIGASSDEVEAIALQPDGRIVAAGTTSGASERIALVRFNPNGTPDTFFGAGGTVVTEAGAPGERPAANAVAIQPDGKIVIAGDIDGFRMLFARYTAAGALDAGFGTGGLVEVSDPNDVWAAYGLALRADGRILAVGIGGDGITFSGTTAVQLIADGSLDASFGSGGIARGLLSGTPRGLSLRADGGFRTSGGHFTALNGLRPAVESFAASGSIDTSFNGTGSAGLSLGTTADNAYSMALQADGKIVVGGQFAGYRVQSSAVARYLANGTLDTSFGSLGLAAVTGSGARVAIQSDGKIVVATTTFSRLRVRRLLADGSVDSGFATASVQIGTSGHAIGGVAIGPDGKIVVAGDAISGGVRKVVVARLLAGGALDTTFNTTGKVIAALGTEEDKGLAVAVQADGKVLVAGWTVTGLAASAFVLRLANDGSVDATHLRSPLPGFHVASALAIQPSGAVVVGVNRYDFTPTSVLSEFLEGRVIRLTPQLTPDPMFSSGGGVPILTSGPIQSLALQTDASVVYSLASGAVGRSTANGDGFPFSTGAESVAPFTTSLPTAVAVLADGQILVAGTDLGPAGHDFAVAKFDVSDEPHPFAFAPLADVAPSTLQVSAPALITGILPATAIAVANGEYCVSSSANCACNVRSFGAVAGTIDPGQFACVRHTSAAGFLQSVTTTLTVATTAVTFTSTTVGSAILTLSAPAAFGSQAVGTASAPQVLTIGNIGPVAAQNLLVAADGDFYVTATTCGAMLAPMQSCTASVAFQPTLPGPRIGALVVLGTSPNALRAEATLVGTGVTSDTTPNAFSFADQFLVPVSTAVTSAPVQITGLTGAAPVSVIGGTFALSSGNDCTGDVAAFGAAPGTVANNQYVCVRHTSSALPGGSNDTQLIIGGLGDTFTTITADPVPAPFALGSQSGVALSSTRVSGAVAISGINTQTSFTISNGQASVNCTGPFVSSGTLDPGSSLCARQTAAAGFGQSNTTTVSVGGVSADFVTTTFAAEGDADSDGIPNAVEYNEARNPEGKDNDVFGVPRLFAMQQYRDFLGREGDAGGIQFYVDGIVSGSIIRAQVIENFFLSPEFSGSVAPIVRLYFATFLRIPDYGGLIFQTDAFRAGTPLDVIANNFTLSPEFQATYGALGNPQYVTLLYQNILGRTPSQGEIDFHVNRLVSGVSRGAVLVGFSESPEYQQQSFIDVYVTMMYVGMLRRAPEQAGFDFWVDYMEAGNPGLALILGFLQAPEYRNRFLP